MGCRFDIPFFSNPLILWRIPDSNRPPLDCEPNALPDELNPHHFHAAKLQKFYEIKIKIQKNIISLHPILKTDNNNF